MGKICKNCGADNSETEQRCLVCKAWLPSLTERVLRKPKGPKFSSSGRRPGLRNYDENVISWPERTDDAEAIWTGERREIGGFPEQFVVDFLDDYYTGRRGLNKKGLKTQTKNKIVEYQCIKCSEFFPRKGQSDGVNWISIDHRVPICEYVVMKAP